MNIMNKECGNKKKQKYGMENSNADKDICYKQRIGQWQWQHQLNSKTLKHAECLIFIDLTFEF